MRTAQINGASVFANKTKIRERNFYSPIELMIYHQERGEKITKPEQRSAIFLEAKKKSPSLAKDMAAGDYEVQLGIIAWPNENGEYAENILPEIEKGNYPALLQEFFIEGDNSNYSLIGGTKTILKNLPKYSGELSRPIKEIGLAERAFVWSNSDFRLEQGLRAIVYSCNHIGRDAGHTVANIDGVPSRRSSDLASRIIVEKADQCASENFRNVVKARKEQFAASKNFGRGITASKA